MNDAYLEREIALLDEHDLVDDDGNVVMSLDEDKLHRIADNNNRRVEDTGDEVPIIIGHTKDDAPEQHQPEIVGWVRKFSVKPLFKTGRKAVFGVARFMKSKIDKIRQFPRRSVELWLKKMMIDPVALLGATTPDRDLGLLKFAANGEQTYTPLSPEEDAMETNSNVDEIVQKVIAALQQTDVWKFVESQMAEQQEAPEGDVPPEEGLPGSDQDEAVPPVAGEVPPEEGQPAEEEEPAKYSMGGSSGTNTFVPGGTGRPKVQYQARNEVVKLQAANHTLSKENHVLRLRLSRAQREKDLIQLETEHGILLDRNEELDFVTGMPDKQYKSYLDKIRKRYQKAPVGGRMYHTAERSRPVGSPSNRSKAEVDKVVEYAARKGIGYEEALSEMAGEKVF